MGNKKDKVPKGTEKLLKMIVALEPQEFIGVCKILGIEVYNVVDSEVESEQVLAAEPTSEKTELNLSDAEAPARTTTESKEENQKRNLNVEIRPAEELLDEMIDKIVALNRVQRRNLQALISSAVRGRKRWR